MKLKLRDIVSTEKTKAVISKVRKVVAAALVAISLPLDCARQDE
jgi:propanediol dehydratase large subunit